MIEVKPEIRFLVDEIENYAQRKFQFRTEIAYLIELAYSGNKKQTFDDLTFVSKFVSNARSILKRIGDESIETVKLQNEFKENLEKSTLLIHQILSDASEEIKTIFQDRYFTFAAESMNNLLQLLYELSWVKNYRLDKNVTA